MPRDSTYTSAPLTSSPPDSPSTSAQDHSDLGPNPAPVATQLDNPSDGYPRRRPQRKVTLDEEGHAGRLTTDSHRSLGAASRRSTQRTSTGSRRAASIDPQAGVLRRMTTGLFTPEKRIGKAPTYLSSVKAAVLSTWLNVLLVFIPIGWALYLAKHNGGKESISDTACFITNFIAIIPLAGLLGFATEEAAMRLGQTMGGLLNATLGNAVELIVAILALIKCELAVVQSSLVGSILSNILLVLGMCFFAGGVRYAEQTVKSTAAQLNASLLLIAVIAVLIPSAFHFSITTSETGAGLSLTNAEEGNDLLAMSHGVAILLLLLYLGYLVFQMWTHAVSTSVLIEPIISAVPPSLRRLLPAPSPPVSLPAARPSLTSKHFYVDDEVTGSTRYPEEVTNVREKIRMSDRLHFRRNKKTDEESSPNSTIGSTVAPASTEGAANPREEEEEEEEEEVPQMNVVKKALMVLITVIVGVTAEFLVDSINGLVEAHPSLSQEWVGLILLPIVGNAAEHFTAVSVSVKDKLDLSISVAVGSSIQIALFVIPVIELLAWTIGKPMTLLFDPYESIVLFLSVLIVNQTLSDGRSNWMEGLVLMFLYLIIAVSFWYYPGSNTATLVGCGGS